MQTLLFNYKRTLPHFRSKIIEQILDAVIFEVLETAQMWLMGQKFLSDLFLLLISTIINFCFYV